MLATHDMGNQRNTEPTLQIKISTCHQPSKNEQSVTQDLFTGGMARQGCILELDLDLSPRIEEKIYNRIKGKLYK